MHIPDGFMNAGTSLGAGAAAVGGLSLVARKAADSLEDKEVPLTGLVAAFVFAAQMINFPVATGTSGHLIGGVLAAVLVGPWAGALCIAVVLLVQALFADGGLTALGLNVLNMGIVTSLVGYGTFVALRKVLPATKPAVSAAAGVAAALSVVISSVAFAAEYAIGGTGTAPVGAVAAAMVGVHAIIGIGEGLITAATVGMVLSVRPDLVYGGWGVAAPLDAGPATPAAQEAK